MNYCSKEYYVTNGMMDPDFRLSVSGIAAISQDCFASLMAKNWHAAFDLRRESKMWIISDFTFHIVGSLPFWGEKIRVEIWLSESPSVKVHADYKIWHNEEVVVQGDSTWAILDIESRRPARANSLLADMEVLPQLALGGHKHPYPKSVELKGSHSHITNRSDGDFNHHVTNMTYLNTVLAALPDSYTNSHVVSELSISFKQESFIGENLECSIYTTPTPDVWNFEIKTNGERLSSVATIKYVAKGDDYNNIDYTTLHIRE